MGRKEVKRGCLYEMVFNCAGGLNTYVDSRYLSRAGLRYWVWLGKVGGMRYGEGMFWEDGWMDVENY